MMKSSKNTTEEGSNPYKMRIFQPESQPGAKKNGMLSKFDGLEQLSQRELIEQGKQDKEVALRIVTDPKLKAKMNYYILSSLGKTHFKVARHFLTSPELLEIGGRMLLSSIGRQHEDVARKMIENEELVATYSEDKDLWTVLSTAHVSIAKMILKREQLCTKKLLGLLGLQYEEIAKEIFTDKKLTERCKGWDLCEMAAKYQAVARILSGFSDDKLIRHLGRGNGILKAISFATPKAKPILTQLYQRIIQIDESPNIDGKPPSPKL